MLYRDPLWVAICIAFLSASALASRCFVNFSKEKYPSCAQLSPNVSLHWTVQNGSITWAADVDGKWDWVGIGISEAGMLGADIAVAAHDISEHEWKAVDYWSTDFVTPQPDAQQDVTLLSVSSQSENNPNGNTLVVMSRALVTCDPAGQDRPVLNDTRQTVIYAYGTGDFSYHGPNNRGQAEVVFLPNPTSAPASGSIPAVQTLDLRIPTFVVPSEPTTYQCVNLAMPSDAKYHIYSYEPVIDNAELVHHFVVYSCRGDAAPATPVNITYDCLSYMECEEFYIGWAPGLGKVDAPPAAALAFGANSSTKYVSLQIHYNNPSGLSGQTDSSGVRLSYSSTLKQYDMGVLTLGSYGISVPPGAPSWSTTPNVCPGSCTAKLAAPFSGVGALTLVESFYHMHMLGRSMVTRHVRDGVELPPLGARDYFSFEYQNAVSIPPATRQLLPGDVLITACTFTGEGRSDVTTFGPGSYQEMCFNFLTYYPYNPDITECVQLSHQPDYSTCAAAQILDQIMSSNDTQAAFAQAVQAGYFTPVPQNMTYKPYEPTCTRTAPPATGGGTVYDGDDDDDEEEKAEEHHRRERNVGGAVAAILIVTALGAIAIVVVYRFMKKKKQLEEEQHLFEKYNPNSIILPVMASAGGAGAGSAALAADDSEKGDDAYSKGSFGNFVGSADDRNAGDKLFSKGGGSGV